MKLAIHQCAGSSGNVAANLAALDRSAARAAAGGAHLLVLPELFLTGYNIGDAVHELAEPADGPSIAAACAIAARHGVALLFGYAERADGVTWNAAAFIAATGERLGSYRKTHLFGPEEQRLFRPGSDWLVAATGGVRVGVLICFDVEFPEAVRALALRGADLIAVPTAVSPPYEFVPPVLVRARAIENQRYVAYVNRVGAEHGLAYFGASTVVAPNGTVLAVAGADEYFGIVEIDPEAIAREQTVYDYVRDRRADLYHD